MPTTSTGMGPFSELMSLGETDLTANYADNRVAFNTHGSETAVIYVSHQNSGGETVQVQVEVWDAVQGWWVVPYDNGTNVITSQLTMTNADKNTRWSLKRLARFETQIRVSARRSAGAGYSITSLVIEAQLGQSRFPIGGNIT